jgi:hypothetical protein
MGGSFWRLDHVSSAALCVAGKMWRVVVIVNPLATELWRPAMLANDVLIVLF